MTVEQADNEGGSSEASGTAAAAADAEAKPEIDDMKRKFREALERKREQNAHASAEGARDTGKVQAHGPASSRRSFRRKSGG